MDEDEEARIRQVFDDHASEAIGKGGMTYVSEELVLKALRELGLTPKEGAIRKLMEDGAEDVVDYVKFRKLYFLAKEQYEVLPEDVSLALNVFSNGGILDMAGFESVMAEIDGGLSKAEIDELLFEGRNELFGAGAKKGAAISVDQFASFLLKRHAEAKSLMSVDGERGQSERLAMPDEEEVRYAKAQVASLRNLRHDEQLEREQGFPSRSEETQSLTSSWLKDSHVRLLSYKGPGDGADRLLELSDAMVELEDAHRVSLGFYTVQFVRSDALAGSSTALVMALSIEDFTVGDVRRLVAEQMSLEVSNTVFTVSKPETDNPLILAGDLSEPCGGSFLTHLFKLLSVQGQPGPATKPTHAVTVYRQPDIVNIRHSNMGVPITNDLLLPAFDAGDVTTLTKTIGCEGEGAPATLRPSDEPLNYSNNGNVLLFADRYDGPGDSRLASIPTTITAEIAKLTLHQSPKRRIIVVKINAPGTAGKTFNFRFASILSCGYIDNNTNKELSRARARLKAEGSLPR
ncbi:hypothetical protein DIPPA_13769 [Diplonema papillatum]|nr:hypothetical protein DIPPA_24540 [Diplonema papillatum]KAJ9454844.1 hypothetical protein DIPPA_13769 [Diplonema papillatum]